jgi:hypothetical protein
MRTYKDGPIPRKSTVTQLQIDPVLIAAALLSSSHFQWSCSVSAYTPGLQEISKNSPLHTTLTPRDAV